MPSSHSVLTSPIKGVWGGRFSIVTQAGANISAITDANFNSLIVRASSHIIVTPANSTARIINDVAAAAAAVPLASMTNNASILLNYVCPAAFAAQTARFYFLVFSGGTIT